MRVIGLQGSSPACARSRRPTSPRRSAAWPRFSRLRRRFADAGTALMFVRRL